MHYCFKVVMFLSLWTAVGVQAAVSAERAEGYRARAKAVAASSHEKRKERLNSVGPYRQLHCRPQSPNPFNPLPADPLLPDPRAFIDTNEKLENAGKTWARALVAHLHQCSRRNVTPLEEQRIIERAGDGRYAQWFKDIENEMRWKRTVFILDSGACMRIRHNGALLNSNF